jgi:hypothetical protein
MLRLFPTIPIRSDVFAWLEAWFTACLILNVETPNSGTWTLERVLRIPTPLAPLLDPLMIVNVQWRHNTVTAIDISVAIGGVVYELRAPASPRLGR